MTRERMYKVEGVEIGKYYFFNRRSVLVRDRRQHNWIQIQHANGASTLEPLHSLRQCKCPLAGLDHWHNGDTERQ